MRLDENPQPPQSGELKYQVFRYLREQAQKTNALADGRLSAVDNAVTAPPVEGQYAQGDFVANSNRGVVLGLAGNQYLLAGWMCVTPSTTDDPPVWAEARYMTGT